MESPLLDPLWSSLSLTPYWSLLHWTASDVFTGSGRGEADQSLPSSAKVKNAWSYTSIPQYFMVWCLVKHRDNFNLPYLTLHHNR